MKIEICSNREWMRVFGPLDGATDDEVAAFLDDVRDRLEHAGFEVELSRGERATVHGWNGYRGFAWSGVASGSFETPTAEEDAAIDEAFGAAILAFRAARTPAPAKTAKAPLCPECGEPATWEAPYPAEAETKTTGWLGGWSCACGWFEEREPEYKPDRPGE